MAEEIVKTENSEKNKRVLRNILSYLIYDATLIVFGLVLPKLYLESFGSEVNGLVSTVKDIFYYLSLLEAGVGLASQQALFKPVASDDRNGINSILSATRHYYLRIGLIYSAISFGFAAIYPICVSSSLGYFTVFIIILLYAVPGVLSFLVQGKYRAFMEVEGKVYVMTNLTTVSTLVGNIVRLLCLILSNNLILIQATYCLPSILQVFVLVIYVRKKYPWANFHEKPNIKALSQKSSVLVHQISSVVFSNTDSIVISMICGLKQASVYTIYMLFFSNLEKLLQAFTGSVHFRLGQMFYSDREKFNEWYDIYEMIYIMMAYIFYTVIAAFLLPVIRIYTSGVNDANYINSTMIILFASVNMLSNVRAPSNSVIVYAGKFDKTRHQAIIEMTINIVVSIIATYRFGIIGCLIGTICALLYRGTAMIDFTNRKILNKSNIDSLRRFLINTLVSFAVLFMLGVDSCKPISYIYIALQAVLNALWIAPLFIVVNAFTEWRIYKRVPELIKFIITKLKKTN